MPYVEVPGVELWYNDTGGAGAPVIFLHAASGTCESWVYQVPAFTAAGYRCVAYDRRNWGRSRPTSARDQPGYVSDDLHGLVDHLGLDRFHLVATAAGGIGGLGYALEHPERVRSLVVANSIGGVQDSTYRRYSKGSGRRKFRTCPSSYANWGLRTGVPTPRAPNVGSK